MGSGILISDEQQDAINLINSGENIFLTGVAGSGKSYTIEQVDNNTTVLVSSTGISALNIGADTAHSVFGLPIGLVTDADMKKPARKCNELFGNYSNVNRLILDEISMTRADYFDLINHRLKSIKKNDKPFGGVQVVCVGDCYQLPSIVSHTERKLFNKKYLSPWFFSSKSYKEGNFKPIELTHVYRQDNIKQVNALNKIRSKQKGWEDAVDKINVWGQSQKNEFELILCTYNKDADIINEKEYNKLTNTERVYHANVNGNFKQRDTIIPLELKLKVGARVIIAANSDINCEDEFRNGIVGTVVEMEDHCVYVESDKYGEIKVESMKFEKYKYSTLGGSITKVVSGYMEHIPLKLASAISVHKSQGMTLDSVAVDLGEKGAFSPALTYVALSRVRDLTDMHLLRPIRYSDIIVDPKVQRFMSKI